MTKHPLHSQSADTVIHVSGIFYTSHLDPFEYGRVKDVHAGIDPVGKEDFWLLHKPLYLPRFLLVHHNTILRGFLDLGDLHGKGGGGGGGEGGGGGGEGGGGGGGG